MQEKLGLDLISIVVPVYNVEKYLDASVKSLENQTYKNIEIILVDDGSTDSCPEICDSYGARDERIIVLHKINGGLSDARNAGLKIARGKYITFIDSDDLVDCRYIEDLYKIIRETNADISFCDYCNIDENCTEKEDNGVGGIEIYSNVACLENLYRPNQHGMEFVAWGKLYDINLFRRNGILYPKGKIHEDTFTTYKLIYYARKIVFLKAVRYFYRIRSGSIMTSKFNEKRFHGLEATREACQFYEEKEEWDLLRDAFNMHLKFTMKIYCEIKENLGREDYLKYKKLIKADYRKDIKEYMKKADIGFKKKVFYLTFYVIPNRWMAKKVLR